jgi:hypothetical protein
MHGEPDVAARVSGRVGCLVMPLNKSLRIREATIHFGCRGGRKEEDFGADLLTVQRAAYDLGRVLKKAGGFRFI